MATLVIQLPGHAVTHQFTDSEVTVGRLPDNRIQIEDSSVSARHARFVLKNGIYLLRDLDSTNGTWISEEPVTVALLQGTCEIRFGTVPCRFSDTAVSAAERRLGEMEETLKVLRRDLETVTGEREEARITAADVGQKLADFRRRAEEAEQLAHQVTEARTRLDFFTKEQAAAKARVTAAEIQVGELKSTLAATIASRDYERRLNEQLTRDTEDLRRQQQAAAAAHAPSMRETELLRKERDLLKAERAALQREVTSLREHREQRQEFPATTDQQIELFTADLLPAKQTEPDLRVRHTVSPRLVNWLHGGKQKHATGRVGGASGNKIVPIDSGDLSVEDSIRKMRAAVEMIDRSPVEALRELGARLGSVNSRVEALPERGAMHRLGTMLGLLVGEMRGVPHALQPSSLHTIRAAIDVLERLSRTSNPSLATPTAIVFDRDCRGLENVMRAMTSLEFQIDCAEDAEAGLAALSRERYDLIFFEWQPPETERHLSRVRTIPLQQQTPVVLLANAETEHDARATGHEVLVKPPGVPELAVKVLTLVLEAQQAQTPGEPVFAKADAGA